MQAKLPDINAAIVRHRSSALSAYEKGNKTLAAISLSSINALFPDEYKVEVNTDKYNQLTTDQKLITCGFCKEVTKETIVDPETNTSHEERSEIPSRIPFKEIELYDMLQDNLESFISNQKFVKVWECPKCNNLNKFDKKSLVTIKFAQPAYFKVIPSPPSKKGIRNRKNYEYEFDKWFDIALSEIESQIGKYRADYMAQQESQAPMIEDA